MIVELHIIQNFAPSNLNRDDSNTPKDCEFGGYRRARISSQCIKRSVRRHPDFADAVKKAGGDVGIRTKRLKARLVEIFTREHGKDQADAEKAAQAVIELQGLKLKDEDKTEYLLYIGESEVADVAAKTLNAWDALKKFGLGADGSGDKEEKKKGKKKKDGIPPELEPFIDAFSRSKNDRRGYAADIALFGRMMADDKNMNVDAACQVAHAISTHKVEMEMDYFTAVDDLLPSGESGSDMIGVVEFNSSCFYRYSNVNLDRLEENLGFNKDLCTAAVLGFVEASVKAVPTGKQNSMAAQNPPGYVRVVVRRDGFPWSLANAFQRPVRTASESSLEELSANALSGYFDRLASAYGKGAIICDASFNTYQPGGGSLSSVLDTLKACLEKEGCA